MNNNRRFLINVISSVTQSLVVAVTLFYLFRYLLHHLDPKSIGVWSVIFATASVSKIAELGISNGVVKFVAKWLALDDRNQAAQVIRTAATSVAILIGLILCVGMLTAPFFIHILVGSEHSELAISILPYALFSFWVGSLTSVYQSGLDGCQRMDYKSVLSIVSTLLYFGACVLLVDSRGIAGLGIAQVFQSVFMLLGNVTLLRKVLPEMRYMLFGWNKTQFSELLKYGLNAQAASVSITLLSEPITKALITNFGGLAMVTYYDMANKMITQLRSVVLSAYQAIVPMVATMQESNKEGIPGVYKKSAEVMFFISIIMFGAIIAFTPIISEVWIGTYVQSFVFSSYVLSMGWCVNTIIVPAYLINLGTGQLKINTVSHLIIGVVNTIAGLTLGYYYGANGSIIAWASGLIIGSLYLIFSFHKIYQIEFKEILNKYVLTLLISVSLFCVIMNQLYEHSYFGSEKSTNLLIAIALFIAVILTTQIRNPLHIKLISFVGTHLAKR